MTKGSISRSLGWTLVALSLALHAWTVFCFSRQPDRFAAFTVTPIWVWGAIGLALSCGAFYFLRAALSLVLTAVWAVTILVGADEARLLMKPGGETPVPGPAAAYRNQAVVRVLTLNCAHLEFGDPTEDIAAWQPDIVLLQEISPGDLFRIRTALYGKGGDQRFHVTNGIATRWKVEREVRNSLFREQQLTVRRPDGVEIEVVNVHLKSAETNLALWKPSAWREHRADRQSRRSELYIGLQLLHQTTTPERPVLFGGDFNCPASDPSRLLLEGEFTDAFAAAGTGWGDTFQRRVPILRLDRLYTTPQLTAVRCAAVTTRHSDHRMVVADFLLTPP